MIAQTLFLPSLDGAGVKQFICSNAARVLVTRARGFSGTRGITSPP
ncbi:MAG TPA: hypothetical protein VFD70_31025 [Anaerolineae bacterium]|nr:hypothetical protein [Anaerolineae bacterium]